MKTVLKCTAAQHGATINSLAARGLIAPVSFTAPDGTRHTANSAWAAYDWLKANGHYDHGKQPIVYHLGDRT